MPTRPSTVVALVGAAAFGAGIVVGLLLADAGAGVRPSPGGAVAGPGISAGGDGTPGTDGAGTPRAGAAGKDGAPGASRGGASRGGAADPGGPGAGPAAAAGPGEPGGGDAGEAPRGEGGAVVQGTRTGRPASTSVTAPPAPAATDAAAAAPSAPARGRTGALAPYSLPARIAGRVTDAVTSAALPGARVSLAWSLSDGTVSSALPLEVAEDGTFSCEPRAGMRAQVERMLAEDGWLKGRYGGVEEALADLEYALEGSAAGYAKRVVGDPGAEVDLRLDPEGVERLTGTVRVEARRADGSRFPSRALVEFLGDGRTGFLQWALPEGDGSFLLPGVPSGPWSLRISGRGDGGTRIRVPEAGEVRVELAVPRAGLLEAEGTPAGEPREVSVAVRGRALPSGSFLRAEARPGLFFRTEVVGESARFAALPAGSWTFVLQVAGRPDVPFPAAVPAGAGTLALEFPATAGTGEPR
jgi:hypothetical protein